MKISRCKGCDAEIIWATTKNGKNIPLDFPPKKRFTIEKRSTWVPSDHRENAVKEKIVEVAHVRDTYMPHHATCPEADQFRRGERG